MWPCGVLGAPHGLDGRSHLRLGPDGLSCLEQGSRFFVSRSDREPPSPVELERCGGSDQRPLVRVGGARTRAAASAWTGGLLLAAGGGLDARPQHVVGDLIGLRAVCGAEEVGTVADVLQGVAQDILRIVAAGGEDVLVPIVDELVEVDLEAGVVRVREGLLG